MCLAGFYLGARYYGEVRAGRGTFINEDPSADALEIEMGKFLADRMQLDLVRQVPVGSRGRGTADYRISFSNRVLELKDFRSTTSYRSLQSKTANGQGDTMAIILNRNQFSEAELSNFGPRVFGQTSKTGVQIIYDTGNGYEMGPCWTR